MGEKAYNTMKKSGAANIAVGVIVLVTGIVTGVILLVSGGKLLKNKGNIMF